jgi:hypothetical protein
MDLDSTLPFDSLAHDHTEEIPALTCELPHFAAPTPLPQPLAGEPGYLVEVRSARRPPMLLAIRTTLVDACLVAEAVHPGVADVVIREVPLPCDAESLVKLMAEMRTWSRDASGEWTPPLPGT